MPMASRASATRAVIWHSGAPLPVVTSQPSTGGTTRSLEKTIAESGSITPSTFSTWRIRSPTSWKVAIPSSLKSSSTVWPSSMVMTLSIAWPPKSAW